MSNGPQMFRINPENKDAKPLEEVDFANLDLRERSDIQEWIANHPGILGDDLLIIGKEFSGFDQTNERPDLLAVDWEGKLVVIELKCDDSGEDVHWQAIRYASYFSRVEDEQIVEILALYKGISAAEAESTLLEHINDEDLNALNYDQRIILVSHRFAPEVVSAVLWLNERDISENLITCVQLTPYRDEEANLLFLQASTIIPGPGIGTVRVGSSLRKRRGRNPNTSDEVTDFLRKVGTLAKNELPDKITPDRTARWAGSHKYEGREFRYYWFSYSRNPWALSPRSTWYEVNLFPPSEPENWAAHVFFHYGPRDGETNFSFQEILNAISDLDEWKVIDNRRIIIDELESDELNDAFAYKIADALRQLIETITPLVDELASESEGEA